MSRQRWQDWAVLVLGAGLLMSPYLFDHLGTPAASNALLAGLALVLFALLSMIDSRIWEAWANFVLGGWLIVAPFVLGYSQTQPVVWIHVAVGLLVVASTLLIIARTTTARRSAKVAAR